MHCSLFKILSSPALPCPALSWFFLLMVLPANQQQLS
jgi:hypothetical protein